MFLSSQFVMVHIIQQILFYHLCYHNGVKYLRPTYCEPYDLPLCSIEIINVYIVNLDTHSYASSEILGYIILNW